MKKLLGLIAIAGGIGVCQAQDYSALLTSQQEVPPNNLTETDVTYGFADFSLSGNVLNLASAFYGNSPEAPTLITINDAPPGFNAASPLFSLSIDNDITIEPGGLVEGSFSGGGFELSPSEINDLYSGDFYLNIATMDEPNGEVRGPITNQSPTTPEPATMTLMGVGFLAWLAAHNRSKRGERRGSNRPR